MNTKIVLTVLAEDQPGIIQTVSNVLKQYGGNWDQSSMSSLAGQFAGILLASVPEKHAGECVKALHGLKKAGLQVLAHISDEPQEDKATSQYSLDLVGNDRPGIVHDITTLLAGHGVSVLDLETRVESASMAGGALFRASATLEVPHPVDVDILADDLEELANDLMVDIQFK